jgi:hypothetical protein
MHDDQDLVANIGLHYHHDLRFWNREPHSFDFGKALLIQFLDNNGRIEYRRRKCRREMPADYPHNAPKWFGKLQEKFKCAKLKNNICPHRGIDLSGCPSVYGTVTCPAHGLIWDRETGDLVEVPKRNLYQA